MEHEVLQKSCHQLAQTDTQIAVNDEGHAKVVHGLHNPKPAADSDGYTVYQAEEMFHYIQLDTVEERMRFHAIKRQYGGTSSWNPTQKGDQ